MLADIGGTYARFAIAHLEGGKIGALSNIKQYPVQQFENLSSCLNAYQSSSADDLPGHAVFAVAAPTSLVEIIFTNSKWQFRCPEIQETFGFERLSCINDFVAAAHLVANTPLSKMQILHNPKSGKGPGEVTTVMGSGTGLGVSYVMKTQKGYQVQETEASHIGFSPTDEFELQLHARLRAKFGRVSAERLACGAGLREFHQLLVDQEERPPLSDAETWRLCLSGNDPLATQALYRYCDCLGSIAGDLVLAQGASQLVMVGSLAGKLSGILSETNFLERFRAKGRFSDMLENTPIYFCDADNPGLQGAAQYAQTSNQM